MNHKDNGVKPGLDTSARSLYITPGKERITYDSAESWLTVHQCGNEWVISIGPFGLIDLGLELCNIGRGHGTDSGLYSHPDGVFHVGYDDGDLIFTEGTRFAVVPMADDDLIDFGLELISEGFGDLSAGREVLYFEERYGRRVTFGKGVEA